MLSIEVIKEMENNEKERTEALMETASFRFGLIAPVIQDTYTDESIMAYCRRVAENPIRLPDGRIANYKPKTIEKWISQYRNGGIAALTPRTRSDLGKTRVLTGDAIDEIYRLKQKFPRLNATQIHDRLVEECLIPARVSVSSVQRYIKKNGLKSSDAALCGRDRKAFEESYFGGMYQADTCYLPYIKENGKSHRTFLLMIVDDYSRLIVGGQIFYQDNAYNFQQVFKEAVATYGIPNKLYVDSGAPYRNGQLDMICASIGAVLLHTPVRDGASKGKVERNFRSVKERWLYGLDITQIHSLATFNQLLKSYIRKHNTTLHTGIGTTPLERYLQSERQPRKPKSEEWLDECFLNRVIRRVGRDATIQLDSRCYDAPMQFIGQKIEIRYLPGEPEKVWAFEAGQRFEMRLTNRVENGRSKRQNQPSIDYGTVLGGERNVH